MAYPDLEESNQVQRDRYASAPVTSGTNPDPTVAPPQRSYNPADPNNATSYGGSTEPVVDTGYGNAMRGVGSVIGNAAGQVFGPNGAVAGAVRGALGIGDASAATPSVSDAPTPATGMHRSGVVIGQPQSDQLRSVPVPQASGGPVITPDALRTRTVDVGTYQTDPNVRTIDETNRAARAELNIINAREARDLQASTDGMRADAARAQGNYDAQRLDSEARFDKFRSKNSADVVLRGDGAGPSARAYERQAAASAGAAAAAHGAAEAAGKVPARDMLAEAVAQNQAVIGANDQIDRGRLAQTAQQNSVIGGNIQKQELEKQTRLNQLGSTLSSSKDPAERQRASDALLSLLGKDKPEEYTVVHAAGGTRMGPDGYTPIKDPDYVVIANKRTGAREIVKLGDQAAAQAAPPENHILALKQNPKLKADFEKKYGAGSADQYLK